MQNSNKMESENWNIVEANREADHHSHPESKSTCVSVLILWLLAVDIWQRVSKDEVSEEL